MGSGGRTLLGCSSDPISVVLEQILGGKKQINIKLMCGPDRVDSARPIQLSICAEKLVNSSVSMRVVRRPVASDRSGGNAKASEQGGQHASKDKALAFETMTASMQRASA